MVLSCRWGAIHEIAVSRKLSKNNSLLIQKASRIRSKNQSKIMSKSISKHTSIFDRECLPKWSPRRPGAWCVPKLLAPKSFSNRPWTPFLEKVSLQISISSKKWIQSSKNQASKSQFHQKENEIQKCMKKNMNPEWSNFNKKVTNQISQASQTSQSGQTSQSFETCQA